jgi:MFS family permease
MGGMIAPAVLAGLIGQDALHNWHWVIIVYGIYAVIAMVALIFIRETRDLRLHELDEEAAAQAAKMRG